jgi:hypothetical protein
MIKAQHGQEIASARCTHNSQEGRWRKSRRNILKVVFPSFGASRLSRGPQRRTLGLILSSLSMLTAGGCAFTDGNSGRAQLPPLRITTTSVSSANVGQIYRTSLAATGSDGAYTWGIASGQLPPRFALKAMSGVIAGTPTQGGAIQFHRASE